MDLATLYCNSIINEPITWYKEKTFIQLIRPRIENNYNETRSILMSITPAPTTIIDNNIETLKYILKQVDISCCGVSFPPLTENVHEAIDDCLSHKFRVLKSSMFYNHKRIDNRVDKLEKRGWKQYLDTIICAVCGCVVNFKEKTPICEHLREMVQGLEDW
jgi:rubrerythrin